MIPFVFAHSLQNYVALESVLRISCNVWQKSLVKSFFFCVFVFVSGVGRNFNWFYCWKLNLSGIVLQSDSVIQGLEKRTWLLCCTKKWEDNLGVFRVQWRVGLLPTIETLKNEKNLIFSNCNDQQSNIFKTTHQLLPKLI